jgi:CO dehydrogenase maturation factor
VSAALPFGLAIRAARTEHGWTQGELGARVGVSQSTISLWEKGTEAPTVEHLIALALALPELIESFEGREAELLRRLLRLERELFDGRCACPGCACQPEPDVAAPRKAASQPNEQQSRTKEWRMRIAVSGKGGVGKTTIAGTLARVLGQQQQRVLALDNDSNPNLAVSLGVSRAELAAAPPIPHGLTEWRQDESGKSYVHLHKPVAAFIADHAVAAPDNTHLIVMGEVLKASVGCRCSSHALARGITGHLVSEADVAILDMEAGLEHFGRGTTEHVDMLLIVVDPYFRSLETAARIQQLAAELGVPRIGVVANRVRTPAEHAAVAQYCRNHTLDLVAVVPYDEAILESEQHGQAPIDGAAESPATQAIAGLATLLRARCA